MTEYVTIEKRLYEKFMKQDEEIQQLKNRLSELERLLAFYQSPHIPSSKKLIKDKDDDQKEEPKKRGAPEGHKGATRKLPKPNAFKDLKPTGCKNPHCNGKIEILNSYQKSVLDVVIKPICTEYTVYRCKCLYCGKEFESTDQNLPKEGIFGPNYSSLMGTLHYQGHIPFANLANISETCFNIDITSKGLHDLIYRTAHIFEPEFQNIKNAVRKSNFVRSDESGYPCYTTLPHKKSWVWVISNGIETAVLMRPSRGTCVIEEVIPIDYKGIFLHDFYSSYLPFKSAKHTGCWSHLLGDSEELKVECGTEGEKNR